MQIYSHLILYCNDLVLLDGHGESLICSVSLAPLTKVMKVREANC